MIDGLTLHKTEQEVRRHIASLSDEELERQRMMSDIVSRECLDESIRRTLKYMRGI